MQDIKKIEFRNSGSNSNTKICFEARATALRPRLHTEGFPLRSHRTPIKGTSTEEFAITNLEYITPLSNTTTSTQEARHKAKTQPQSPLHKRDRHKAKTQSPLYKEGQGTMPKLNHLYTKRDKAQSQSKEEIINLVITIDHKQHLVITKDHKQFSSQK